MDAARLDLMFRVYDPHLEVLLEEFYDRFTQTVDEVKRYSRAKNF